MKKPAPEVLAIIEQLRKADTILNKFTGKAVRLKLDLLEQIMTHGDWWVAPTLFCLVFDTNAHVARKSAQVIHAIINARPTRRLLELDQLIREISQGQWTWVDRYPDLRRQMPRSIKHLMQFGETRSTLLGIASFDASGHVREAAVKALGGLGEGAALPYILIRLGDWVKPVREAAEQAFEGLMKVEHATSLIENLDLAARLAKRTRIGKAPLHSMTNVLKNAEAQPLLLAQLDKPFSPTRRECIRLLLEAHALDPLELAGRISGRPEMVEELVIAEAAFKRATDQDVRQVYGRFGKSLHGIVRKRALLLLSQHQPELATEALWQAIFDNASIRDLARCQLKRLGVGAGEIANAYREGLRSDTPSRLRSSLAGLGEVGVIQDCEIIIPFLDSPQVGVAKAAIHALAQLTPGQFYTTLVQLLQSPAAGISKQAREEILRNPALADFGELWNIYMHTATPHVRSNLFRIFNMASKWERLGLMLGVVRHGDEEEQAKAQIHLKAWYGRFNRTFVQPSPGQMERIQGHLNALAPQQDSGVLRQIRLIIQQRL